MLLKTLKMNEKAPKNQGVIFTKLLVSDLIIALEYQTWYPDITVMLKHNDFTLWADRKRI